MLHFLTSNFVLIPKGPSKQSFESKKLMQCTLLLSDAQPSAVVRSFVLYIFSPPASEERSSEQRLINIVNQARSNLYFGSHNPTTP